MTAIKIVDNQGPTIWTDVDVSSVAGSNSTVVTLLVHNKAVYSLDFHYRQRGGIEIAPQAIFDGRTEVVEVDLDSNKIFQYYVTQGTVDIWLISWRAQASFDTSAYYSVQSEIYTKGGMTSAQIPGVELAIYQRDTDAKIDEMFGKSWANATSQVDWIDTYDEDVAVVTIEPPEIDRIFLTKTPVQAITTFESYDIDGNLVKTRTSSDYWLDSNLGILTLRDGTFVNQRQRIKVAYSYGYSSPPINIRNLANVLSAISAWTEFLGKKWEMPSSIGVPNDNYGSSVQGNIKDTIGRLEKERDELIGIIGRRKLNFVVV